MLTYQQPDDLDPRRRSRSVRRRDWKSVSATITVGRIHELLATVLVRLGLVR